MFNEMSLDEMRTIMTEAEAWVPREDIIEIKTRHLELDECQEFHQWLIELPCFEWDPEDAKATLAHLLETQAALVTLPINMAREAIYCKVKWG